MRAVISTRAISMNNSEFVNAMSWPPMRAIVKKFLISNWWIGSIAGLKPFNPVPRGAPSGCHSPGRRVQRIVPDNACRPHHVENARRKTEQQKYNHSPRRNPEPPVDEPAET